MTNGIIQHITGEESTESTSIQSILNRLCCSVKHIGSDKNYSFKKMAEQHGDVPIYPGLQIRGGIEDDSKIFILISQ